MFNYFTFSSLKFYLSFSGLTLIFINLSSCLVLSGCYQVREGLGLTRSQPDEFTVQDQPPLQIPPSLTLKPPAKFPVYDLQDLSSENVSQEKAKRLILKSSFSLSEKTSSSVVEIEMMKSAEKQPKNPDIRSLLEQEEKEKSNKLQPKFFSGKKSYSSSETLKPHEEISQRLTREHEEDSETKTKTFQIKDNEREILSAKKEIYMPHFKFRKILTYFISYIFVLGQSIYTLAYAPLNSPSTYGIRYHKFQNGLELVVLENHRAPLVVHIMGFKVGTNESPVGKSGLAHYLEHLMFKGKPDLDTQIHQVGGEFNAQTSSNYTFYYEVLPAAHLETALKINAERMENLIIEDTWARPEIDVILEERRMRIDSMPMGKFMEALNLMTTYNHPSRLPTIGWSHEIKKYISQDAQQFYHDYYMPNNAFIVIAGDVKFEEAKDLVEKYYGSLADRPLPQKIDLVEPSDIQVRQTLEMDSQLIDKPIYLRQYKAPNFQQEPEKFYALILLETLLGQNIVGRFTSNLVEKQRLAQYCSISYLGLSPASGSFQFILSPGYGISMQTLEIAFEQELEKLLKQGISKSELDKAQESILAQKIYIQDDIIMGAIEVATLLGCNMPFKEIDSYFTRIKAVTLTQVYETLKEVLKNPYYVIGRLNPSLTLYPEKSQTSYAEKPHS